MLSCQNVRVKVTTDSNNLRLDTSPYNERELFHSAAAWDVAVLTNSRHLWILGHLLLRLFHRIWPIAGCHANSATLDDIGFCWGDVDSYLIQCDIASLDSSNGGMSCQRSIRYGSPCQSIFQPLKNFSLTLPPKHFTWVECLLSCLETHKRVCRSSSHRGVSLQVVHSCENCFVSSCIVCSFVASVEEITPSAFS
jgi:hypothetical protein